MTRAGEKTAISRGTKRVWYYEVHGAVYGPVSADAIYGSIVNGELQPDVNVWMTGSSGWTPAADRVFFTEVGPDAEDVAWQDSLPESEELPPMVSRDGNTAYHRHSAAGEATSQPLAKSDDIDRGNGLQRSRGYDTPNPSSSRYAVAGGSSIAYAAYLGVLAPWIAASDMRSSVGEDAIAANSDAWAAAMGKLWGISLTLGAVFLVIGIAILRVKDSRSKRILTWCGVAAVLLIWLVETAISAKSEGMNSPMLGFFDILYEGALLGTLFSRRKVGQKQDLAAAGDDQPKWRYRDKSGRTSSALLSTDELRREIASGRLSRDVDVWTEGTGKWRPASSYAAFSKEKIGSDEQ
jgi:hypothetical protein